MNLKTHLQQGQVSLALGAPVLTKPRETDRYQESRGKGDQKAMISDGERQKELEPIWERGKEPLWA